MRTENKSVVLIILDGWGYSETVEYNAIVQTETPHWDALCREGVFTLLNASGESVGLPDGQMGNSEVGHMHMGAGRVIEQDLTRINRTLSEQGWSCHPVFQAMLAKINPGLSQKNSIHVMGLLSEGGVHSHQAHALSLLQALASAGCQHVFYHVFLDGRDVSPQSSETSLRKLLDHMTLCNCGDLVSLIGRYYAMDRDKRWSRTREAYDLLTEGKALLTTDDPIKGLNAAYDRGETDEFVKATRIWPKRSPRNGLIQEGDVLISMNFRPDRIRQLTSALLDSDLDVLHFHPDRFVRPISFFSLTAYQETWFHPIFFPARRLKHTLGECLSQAGLRQLRIAETEKYAHVTFFFNGGREKPFYLEDRDLIPSPPVSTYNLKPEMSAYAVTETLLQAIHGGQYALILVNFANPDMLGHTGLFQPTCDAIACIDQCIAQIKQAVCQSGSQLIITADHGNAECMYDPVHQQPHTAHTNHPVPFVYWVSPDGGHRRKAGWLSQHMGSLADIAPTVLDALDQAKPKEMTGRSLLS